MKIDENLKLILVAEASVYGIAKVIEKAYRFGFIDGQDEPINSMMEDMSKNYKKYGGKNG